MSYRDLDFNYSDFQIEVIKISKKFNMHITLSNEGTVEFVSNDEEKKRAFAEEIHRLNPKTKLVDIISSGLDRDVRGNLLDRCTNLHLVDDDYYNWITEKGKETRQVEMF